MASLFDKKERNPLSVLIYSVFLVMLRASDNNPKIRDNPSLYNFIGFIHLLFRIYIIYWVIMLLIGTFKEQKKEH